MLEAIMTTTFKLVVVANVDLPERQKDESGNWQNTGRKETLTEYTLFNLENKTKLVFISRDNSFASLAGKEVNVHLSVRQFKNSTTCRLLGLTEADKKTK